MNAAVETPAKVIATLPDGACDTHCHVFGPQHRFPFAANARFRPQDAPKEALFRMHDAIGIQRCVIVQSGCHGFDNSAMLDAMDARSGRYLGVALLPTDVSEAALRDHAERGVRGIRFNLMPHLEAAAGPDEIVAFSRRLAPLGLHLQIHMEAGLLAEALPVLAGAATPVVIDHMGRIDASLGQDQAPFAALMRAMEDEMFHVKVSGADRASRTGSPYADAVPFARRLAETFPDRVFWGTDWPHPNISGPVPDDAVLAGLLPKIAPNGELLEKLLVRNPARFYRFGDV